MIEAYCILPNGVSRVVFVSDKPPIQIVVPVYHVARGCVRRTGQVTLAAHWEYYGDRTTRRLFYCRAGQA